MQAGSASLGWQGWGGVKAMTGILSLAANTRGGVEGGSTEGGMKLTSYMLGRRALSNTLVAEDHPRCFL
jgi:hypothetical protein